MYCKAATYKKTIYTYRQYMTSSFLFFFSYKWSLDEIKIKIIEKICFQCQSGVTSKKKLWCSVVEMMTNRVKLVSVEVGRADDKEKYDYRN